MISSNLFDRADTRRHNAGYYASHGKRSQCTTTRTERLFPKALLPVLISDLTAGATYYLVLLTAETPSAPIARGLNAFPKWQLHCAAVFDSGDASQEPVLEQHLIPKERVLPDQSPEVMRALAVKATKHISSLHGAEHRLKAVTGVEQQVTTFNMVATHPGGGEPERTTKTISVDYVSFLTDTGVPHMAALTSMESGGAPTVAATSTGIPRHLVVSWDVAVGKGELDPKATPRYRASIATALRETLAAAGHSDWGGLQLSDPLKESDAWPSGLQDLVQVNLQPSPLPGQPHVLAAAISVRPPPSREWSMALQSGHLDTYPGLKAIRAAVVSNSFPGSIAQQLQTEGVSVENTDVKVSNIQASTPYGRSFWSSCQGKSLGEGGDTDALTQEGSSSEGFASSLHQKAAWNRWEIQIMISFLGGGLFAGAFVGLLWWRSSKGEDDDGRGRYREIVPLIRQ